MQMKQMKSYMPNLVLLQIPFSKFEWIGRLSGMSQ